MKQPLIGALLAACAAFGGIALATESPPQPSSAPNAPSWAFAMDPPETAHPQHRADDDELQHVPGSDMAFSRAQTKALFAVADWHPNDHPPAPDIVMKGRRPRPAACAYCHRTNGMGVPENASLAGMSEAYILAQLQAYRDGSRGTANPAMVSHRGMVGIAKAITDDEAQAAAKYFSSLKPTPWVKVVETAIIPKTRIIAYTHMPDPAGGTEPLGRRIIETPADPERFELRDSRSGLIAYVPRGSIKKGKAIAKTGADGRSQPCAVCHGADLRGVGDVPPIAGRVASNLARQLYNFKDLKRTGGPADLMTPVAANLTDDEIISVVAYVSSLKP